jgi:hypothetical protein
MCNQVIAKRTQDVEVAAGQGQRLTVIPITGSSAEAPSYRMLDEHTLPHVRIMEISEAGSVPELLVWNDLDDRVFLMDGQELVGAKQNRILNTDVLVSARSPLKIPVSCVEQGRWSQQTPTFGPGKSATHRSRGNKARRVYASLRSEQRHDADQSAVWSEVQESLAAAKAVSPTMALSDAYASRQRELDRFRQSLTMPDNAVGLAVFESERLRGIDLFDRHDTLAYFWSSLVDSYAIDLLDQPEVKQSSSADAHEKQVKSVLEWVAGGNWECFAAPGEGKDWRLDEGNLSGSALIWEEQVVVHLQIFPRYPDEQAKAPQTPRPATRIHRRWMR